MARSEAKIENFFSALFPRLNETRYPERKTSIPKTNGSKYRTQEFFDSHFCWRLSPLYKKANWYKKASGWLAQPLDSIQVANQAFEELKQLSYITNWVFTRTEMRKGPIHLSNSKSTHPFKNHKAPYSSQKACRHCKISGLRKQKSSCRNLHYFPVPLRCKFSTQSSLRMFYIFEMLTSGR